MRGHSCVIPASNENEQGETCDTHCHHGNKTQAREASLVKLGESILTRISWIVVHRYRLADFKLVGLGCFPTGVRLAAYHKGVAISVVVLRFVGRDCPLRF